MPLCPPCRSRARNSLTSLSRHTLSENRTQRDPSSGDLAGRTSKEHWTCRLIRPHRTHPACRPPAHNGGPHGIVGSSCIPRNNQDSCRIVFPAAYTEYPIRKGFGLRRSCPNTHDLWDSRSPFRIRHNALTAKHIPDWGGSPTMFDRHGKEHIGS